MSASPHALAGRAGGGGGATDEPRGAVGGSGGGDGGGGNGGGAAFSGRGAEAHSWQTSQSHASSLLHEKRIASGEICRPHPPSQSRVSCRVTISSLRPQKGNRARHPQRPSRLGPGQVHQRLSRRSQRNHQSQVHARLETHIRLIRLRPTAARLRAHVRTYF